MIGGRSLIGGKDRPDGWKKKKPPPLLEEEREIRAMRRPGIKFHHDHLY